MGKAGQTRGAMYKADRAKGMTYRQIAEKYGVSTQRVQQVCCKHYPYRFRVITDKCVYPNLRDWMNRNRISRNELLRRMGESVHPEKIARLSDCMNGKYEPRKSMIDKLIKATGMSYEVLFAREEDHG